MPWTRIKLLLLFSLLCMPVAGQTICGGLGQTDAHRDSLWRREELRSRFDEQMLQTRLGAAFAWSYKNLGVGGKLKDYSFKDGTAIVCTSGNWTAMTMGNFIIGGDGLAPEVNNKTYQHEYGHYLQSQDLGHYYVMLIAIPSIMSKVIMKGDHHFSDTEQDANIRAYSYFRRYYPDEIEWDFESNPILGLETGVFPEIAPTRFDRIMYGFNPIIGTLVGGIVHGARKNEK